MSDGLTLYRAILKIIASSQVRFHDLRSMFTFVWAVGGVLMEQNVHSTSRGCNGLAKPRQREKMSQPISFNPSFGLLSLRKRQTILLSGDGLDGGYLIADNLII